VIKPRKKEVENYYYFFRPWKKEVENQGLKLGITSIKMFK
jgi:hypothetical protein